MIQLYVGNQYQGCQLWEDTLWADIAEAREKFPNEVYRQISIIDTPYNFKEFMATPLSCELTEEMEDLDLLLGDDEPLGEGCGDKNYEDEIDEALD